MRKSFTQIVVAVLFLFGQIFAVAHAAEFGTDTHEHDGVVCLAIINDEYAGLELATAQDLPVIAATRSEFVVIADQSFRDNTRSIRPPPTGPPSI